MKIGAKGEQEELNSTVDGQYIQAVNDDAVVNLEIRDLQKKFGSKMVLKSVNLSAYKDEILVLLGCNCAGKTTTLSMITGAL